MDVEAAAAAVEAELDAQEWNMQEIERIQEEQVRSSPEALALSHLALHMQRQALAARPCMHCLIDTAAPVPVQGHAIE